MEPEGDDVRGGVEIDSETESGVEGCSGLEAGAGTPKLLGFSNPDGDAERGWGWAGMDASALLS